MINIYKPDETVFTHNGLGALKAVSAYVTEELNGVYGLEITVIAGANDIEYIMNDYVIKAEAPRGYQLFRIFDTCKSLEGTIRANARHVFYDNLYNNVDLAEGSELTADEAIKLIFGSTAFPNRFTVSSQIPSTVRAAISIRDVNPVNALLRTDTSSEKAGGGLIQLFGGELLRDNFDIKLMPVIGADRGFVVKYRKNLTGLDFEENGENIFTRIKPVAKDADDMPLYLPEIYVDSPYIGRYFMPKIGVREFSGLKVGDGGKTQDDVFVEMRERALETFTEASAFPFKNAKINFALLSQSVQYRDFAPLEEIQLGDIVTVRHDALNVDIKSRCIKYTYNCLLNKYESIELGGFKDNLGATVNRTIASISGADTGLAAHVLDASKHLSESDRAWLDKAKEQYPVEDGEEGEGE